MRKRCALSKDNRQYDASDQRNDSDVQAVTLTKNFVPCSSVQQLARSCMDQTSVTVKAGEHSHAENVSHKKKKRLLNGNPKNDGNPDIVRASMKAKITKSDNELIVQPNESVCHTNNKKLCSATVEDSGRKNKKRKVDSEGNKLEAGALSWKSDSESVTHTTDSTEIPSTSSVCDLQHLEDSVVDDFVSVNVMKLYKLYFKYLCDNSVDWSKTIKIWVCIYKVVKLLNLTFALLNEPSMLPVIPFSCKHGSGVDEIALLSLQESHSLSVLLYAIPAKRQIDELCAGITLYADYLVIPDGSLLAQSYLD